MVRPKPVPPPLIVYSSLVPRLSLSAKILRVTFEPKEKCRVGEPIIFSREGRHVLTQRFSVLAALRVREIHGTERADGHNFFELWGRESAFHTTGTWAGAPYTLEDDDSLLTGRPRG